MSTFQFRISTWPIISGITKSSHWKEIILEATNTNEFVPLIESVVFKRRPDVLLPELYADILAFHEIDPAAVFSISNFTFEIESNECEVLKVCYTFEVRLGDDDITKRALKAREKFEKRSEKVRHKVQLFPEFEPKKYSGKFTIMA